MPLSSNASTANGRPAVPAPAGERLGALYEKHGRMVLGLCRIIVYDPQDAEDAAQQTFLLAYRAMLDGTNPRDPAAWLGTIARNECRSRMRARTDAPAPFPDHVPAGPDPCDVASEKEDVRAVLLALSELSERQRQAVVLRSVYGLSYREVAKALGTSVASVETLIFRGRRRLSAAARPQIAAAQVLLVLPATPRGDLMRLIPGFETGAAAAGVAGAGTAAAGLGIAGAIAGGSASGTAGIFGTPIAAKIVAAVAAATIGVAAGPEIVGPEPHGAPATSAATGPAASRDGVHREAATPARVRAAKRAITTAGTTKRSGTRRPVGPYAPSPSTAAAPPVAFSDVAPVAPDGDDGPAARVPTTGDRGRDGGGRHRRGSSAGDRDDGDEPGADDTSEKSDAERHKEPEPGDDRTRTDGSTTPDSDEPDEPDAPESAAAEATAP